MTRRRRDRASEEEPAKSDDGLTGADPEEANQMTSPSGSLQSQLLNTPNSEKNSSHPPPCEPRKFKINQSSTQNLQPIKV
ncbi:hypothetical protein T02_3830 [Trichinella nativa]|uniref:Uncharacterized protein n=1 Tax=Trichinella nativa TaxID=6335 RepID=A0A0V1LLR3_9BILA|nr:hypothetical protein T02_3830 [Trichinella nativa]